MSYGVSAALQAGVYQALISDLISRPSWAQRFMMQSHLAACLRLMWPRA